MKPGPSTSQLSSAAELALELHEAHRALSGDLWAVWGQHRDKSMPAGVEKFQRMSVVTLSHMAAVTAVDVAMSEEQFINVCLANYREAVKRAPRWG